MKTTKCPHCGNVDEPSNIVGFASPTLIRIHQRCSRCGEYYEDQYKVHFLGSTSYGCNLYPADGETEASMYAAGVELED